MAILRFFMLMLVLGLPAQPALGACLGRLEGDFRAGGGEYDPFDPLDLRHTETVTVRNSGDETCDFVVGFRRQPADGRLGSLSYRLEDVAGQSLLSNQSPGGGAAYLVLANVPPLQAASANYYLMLPRGQFALPGLYDDAGVALWLRRRDRSGTIGMEEQDTKPLPVTQTVKASVSINIAGGGLATTLSFGELAKGLERSVTLQTRANYGYWLTLRSANGSTMKLDPEISGQNWTVPYSLRVNSQSVLLAPAATLRRPVSTLSLGEESHILAFRIEDATDRHAGRYRDVITVEIAVEP